MITDKLIPGFAYSVGQAGGVIDKTYTIQYTSDYKAFIDYVQVCRRLHIEDAILENHIFVHTPNGVFPLSRITPEQLASMTIPEAITVDLTDTTQEPQTETPDSINPVKTPENE